MKLENPSYRLNQRQDKGTIYVSATKNQYKTDEKRVTLSPGEWKEEVLWKKGSDSTRNKS